MPRTNKFGYLIALLIIMAEVTVQAQDVRSGLCPSSNSDRFSTMTSGGGFSGGSDLITSPTKADFLIPQFSPALLDATSFGPGAVATFQVSGSFILRTSLIGLTTSSLYGLSEQNAGGILMPVEFGLRLPIVHSVLGTMDYTLYGETTAGLLLGMAIPTGGSFLSYSIPNSRFAVGASAYLGLGNTLRFDRYVGLYLNGGAGYFDLLSTAFMPRTSYLYPSISLGFLFNIAQ